MTSALDARIRQQSVYLRQHPEFAAVRADAERDAKALLDSKGGRFSHDDAEHFLNACNRELLVRNPPIFDITSAERSTRFGPAFIGANRRKMLCDLDRFNATVALLWHHPADSQAALAEFWSSGGLKGATRGLPTTLAYLKAPGVDVVWLPQLARAASVLAGRPLSQKPSLANYLEYREVVDSTLRWPYSFKPQELDYILSYLGDSRWHDEP